MSSKGSDINADKLKIKRGDILWARARGTGAIFVRGCKNEVRQ